MSFPGVGHQSPISSVGYSIDWGLRSVPYAIRYHFRLAFYSLSISRAPLMMQEKRQNDASALDFEVVPKTRRSRGPKLWSILVWRPSGDVPVPPLSAHRAWNRCYPVANTHGMPFFGDKHCNAM